MFGRKTKELTLRLEEAGRENEQLKSNIEEMTKRIAALEAEVARFREQEASVARAITEAGKAAARIEADADKKRTELIEEANRTVEEAKKTASGVINKADSDAADTRRSAEEYMETAMKEADSYSASTRSEADSYAENTRTDVNIYVERSIMASQLEVRKRRNVMEEMNELLKRTVAYLTEQNDSFISMLESVIEDNARQTDAVCADVEKCSCSCKDCEHPCSEAHTEEKAETEKNESAAEEAAAEENAEETELPEEYDNPAQLMRNIYYILKRRLPDSDAEEGTETEPASVNKPEIKVVPRTSPADKVESELPHDDELSQLVSDVV